MNDKIEWGQILLADLLKSANENTGCEPSLSCFHRAFDELRSYVFRLESNIKEHWMPIDLVKEGEEVLVTGNFMVLDTPDGDYYAKATKIEGIFYAHDENGEVYEPGWLTHFTNLPRKNNLSEMER